MLGDKTLEAVFNWLGQSSFEPTLDLSQYYVTLGITA